MRKIESETGAPRPGKIRKCENAAPRLASRRMAGKLVTIVACALLLVGAVLVGYHTAPEDDRRPVLLASGEVILQPCSVTVEGESIVLVENEETAEEVVDRVKDEYKNASTTSVKIEEETSIENMELENGDEKPEILTAREASEQIVDSQALTVMTTEVVEDVETVAYRIIEKKSDELHLGETRTAQRGQKGLTRVKKKVIKENGIVVSENILEQETIRACVPEIIVSGTAGLVRPLEEFRLTSGFGERWGRLHSGLDMAIPTGSPIYAAKGGCVTCAEYSGSYGNLIKIDHGDGMETYYAHCSRLDVVAGQQVTAGQQIAAVGSTGNSTGPHLHFEVRIDGVAQDPAPWLDLE